MHDVPLPIFLAFVTFLTTVIGVVWQLLSARVIALEARATATEGSASAHATQLAVLSTRNDHVLDRIEQLRDEVRGGFARLGHSRGPMSSHGE